MQNKLATIKLFLSGLESKGLITSINRIDTFHDEPKYYQYGITLNYLNKYSDGITPPEGISAAGSSLTSKYDALLYCLYEAVERLSVYCFRKKSVIFSTRHDLKEASLNLSHYNDDITIDHFKIGWVKGRNITQNAAYLIPAHFIYLNFSRTYKEPQFTAAITTGAAGGFTHEETILRGIYEIVERDSFVTAYLNKISLPRISVEKIRSKILQTLLASLERYNLQLYVFETTNDLQIPSFASIVIDRTGMGPAVSVGLKSGFNTADAIIGSIKEALNIRSGIRYQVYKNKTYNPHINPKLIKTFDERALYWFSPEMIKKISFLLESPEKPLQYPLFWGKTDYKKELTKVRNLLEKKGHVIYFSDISLNLFRKLNYKVYKVIIPTLQPVYLNEKQREIRMDRLKVVARYFGKKKYYINPIPHPFL